MAVPGHWRKPWCGHGLGAFAVALAAALALPAGQALAARSAVLVVDGNTGRVLHESSPDEPRHPASLAKMMTLYVVFEQIERGQLGYQTRIKMSANAVATAPSRLGLEEGEELALIDAVKVLITKSANDVAVAVAEHIAGSEERFARLMTHRARQLGMTATTFRNASGLPDDAQITTARDMATLALRLQDDFPTHYPLFATRSFTYKDETFRNHNTLLFHYPGAEGLKTGYTRASGFNLVTSVRRGRKHVVGVVFGGASAASRNTAMRTYLNMGLVRASAEKTRKPAAPLVAGARPAPERRIAAVPTPQRVERPPPVVPTSGSAEAQPPRQLIEIARVRPVLVAPRGPAGEAADPPGAPGPGSIEALLEQQGGTPQPQYVAGAAGPYARARTPPPDRPALFSDHMQLRGAAPSTLDHQAANLARGDSPLAASPPPRQAAAPPPASARAGAFQIQIGAFQSQADAQRQLALVAERAGAVLAGSAPATQQVRQGDKLLFRARYAGFAAQTAAADACSELKRLKLDCIVVKGE